MKLYLLSLFAAFEVSAGKQSSASDRLGDCVDCLDDIDEARDCLRICNNQKSPVDGRDDISLLEECLDADSDYYEFDDIEGLVECCAFDDIDGAGDCERDMMNVQDCLGGCFDKCISEDAIGYVDCVRENTQYRDCSLTTCLDGLLSDETGEEFTGGENDIFDISKLSSSVNGFTEDQLKNCGMMDDFITGICDIGRTCCERCEPKMGELVSCLVNDIVIPFVALEKNTTIDTCAMDTDNCRLCGDGATLNSAGNCNQGGGNSRGLREVSAEEAPLFNKAMSLPSSTKRNARVEAILASPNRRRVEETSTEELITHCENKMRMEMVSADITEATNNYMECVTGAAMASLSDEGTESGAASVARFVGLVLAMGAALLF